MKTIKNSLLVIAIVITAGCSSTPKVVKTYPSPMKYTLGQEPQKVEYANQGKLWNANARAEQADRLEHQRKMKLLEYMAAEQNFAATNGIPLLVPQAAPPSAPASRPQSRLQQRGSGRSASLRGGWGTYPDQSFRGQMSLLGSGLTAFLLPHSKAGRERGIVTSFTSTSSANSRSFTATARVSGRVGNGKQIPLTTKALEHQRSINPNFDRDQRRGYVEKGSSTTIQLVGAGQFQSAGTPSQPRLR